MLLPSPETLRNLIARYEELQVRHAEQGTYESARELEDATYTLCVSTGTRTPEAALLVAQEHLSRATAAEAATPSEVALTA
ncbi:DUF5133 domain-containing protein [Streptomyces sp. Ru73]|uniref:DUF5133 domain-containing protein n=1 Tax=Streptomyces sp. Ru73 TaxID=2080748 RepID=UPI000CDE0D12|nr:DUF5133 domain-containing protein [Streptomyces sp. Ru73]POX37438.1 DUF5133 domain-containing protein [Streptomyces sp. Ru73]